MELHPPSTATDRRDAIDALWSSLARRVHSSPEDINGLTNDEKVYFAALYFYSEHFNGGFEQVFFNGTGDYYREIVAGLAAIGADETCRLLEFAARITFNGEEPPTDDGDRATIMSSHISEQWEDDLDLLDGAVYNSGENLIELAARFAMAKGLM